MKKLITLLLIAPVLVFALIVASCTKEGPQGPKGEDGIDGANGVATCGQCHNNSQILTAAINQWEHSTHATGGNYERNSGECAVCHTSQGFLGFNIDGTYDPEAEGASIANPNPINCYTCHQIHSTYTGDDLAFTLTDAAELRNTDGATFDFGKANLCATCHQGRTVDPFPVEGGADITVTSSRYGVHHAPQANTIAGMGLFEPGSGYNNHAHSGIENACVTCHMADAYGAQAGGHTMNIAYEYHGATELNLAGCMECHSDEDALIENTEELQAEVQALLDELKVLLDAAGITAEGSDSSIPGTYSVEVAGACLNYKALVEDRSLGVHNPTYIKRVLNNSIAALQ
ncbi:MAG TPA: hypothetical protein VK994_01155 [Bacteroidales bacterium]|nr:hypothetical protein [Bacteroidales bacterium]